LLEYKVLLYIFKKNKNLINNLDDDKNKQLLTKIINIDYKETKHIGVYILAIKPEFIKDYFNNSNFLQIVFDSYLTSKLLVDYLINNHNDKIKELLKKIMDNEDNYKIYKYLGLYILEKKPEFIIDYFKKDNFLQIIYDIYDLHIFSLINYLINFHNNEIKELLKKIIVNKYFFTYRNIVVYILEKKPEFIIDYFEEDNILKIVVNMSDNFLNYIIDNHEDKIKELLKKIMDKDNYKIYKYLGLYILNKKTEFIKDYLNNSNFEQIETDSFDYDFQNLYNFLNIYKNK
jgi:hypothetical protein